MVHAGPTPVGTPWTADQCLQLQDSLDSLFGQGEGLALKQVRFSLTFADPSLPDCPLVGCSDGFCDLTGWDMDSIVGKNCRFLIDPVPKDQVIEPVRVIAKDFITAVENGKSYTMPQDLWQDFMPAGQRSDAGVFCLQMNARRDGTLFRNMFYMREVEINDRPYIIGLQAKVEDGDLPVFHKACKYLDQNMLEVQKILASKFWCTFGMMRQEDNDADDGFLEEELDLAKTNRIVDLGDLARKHIPTKPLWNKEQAAELQTAVNKVFRGKDCADLKDLHLSLTVADPCLDSCPLIGCSTGFTQLTGYDMDEVVGFNCKFLVEPVPAELVNSKVKRLAREFCVSAAESYDFKLKPEDQEAWMPDMRHADDGLFLAQRNARKDGTLFANMFYLRRVELDGRPFVIGLQAALPLDVLSTEGAAVRNESLQSAQKACRVLDANMGVVERALAKLFWYSGPMRRTGLDEASDGGYTEESPGEESFQIPEETTPPLCRRLIRRYCPCRCC